MEKGINLQIEEFKTSLAQLIGKSGMPIALTEVVISALLQEIHMVKVQQVEKEKQEFEKSKENKEKDDIQPKQN